MKHRFSRSDRLSRKLVTLLLFIFFIVSTDVRMAREICRLVSLVCFAGDSAPCCQSHAASLSVGSCVVFHALLHAATYNN